MVSIEPSFSPVPRGGRGGREQKISIEDDGRS